MPFFFLATSSRLRLIFVSEVENQKSRSRLLGHNGRSENKEEKIKQKPFPLLLALLDQLPDKSAP